NAAGTNGIGTIQSGLAIANTGTTPASVTLEVANLDGSPAGLSGSVNLAASGQFAGYLNGITGLDALPPTFRGVLRISSSAQISVVGLRGRSNERSEYITTTLAPWNEALTPPASGLYFPQIADGDGYVTEVVLFSSQPGQVSTGIVRFFSQTGGAWNGLI